MEYVFLDLDDVLVDFCGAALAAHGRSIADYPPGVYELEVALHMPKERVWGPIDGDPVFWHNLKPYPWAQLLPLRALRVGPVRVLSKAHNHPHCYAGKRWWCNQILPGLKLWLVDDEKHLLARSGRLLIDDADYNVEAWRNAGGQAILFPRPWNKRHAESYNAIETVLAELKEYE